MELPSWENYGKYSSDNYGVNTLVFYLPSKGSIWFSYKTPVAFYTPETGLICSENIWSVTTGKHLNWIQPDKKQRVAYEKFKVLFETAFGG